MFCHCSSGCLLRNSQKHLGGSAERPERPACITCQLTMTCAVLTAGVESPLATDLYVMIDQRDRKTSKNQTSGILEETSSILSYHILDTRFSIWDLGTPLVQSQQNGRVMTRHRRGQLAVDHGANHKQLGSTWRCQFVPNVMGT